MRCSESENQFLSLFSSYIIVTCFLLISLSRTYSLLLPTNCFRQNAICILKLQSTATPHTKRFLTSRAVFFRENSAFALSHRVHIYLSFIAYIVIRKKNANTYKALEWNSLSIVDMSFLWDWSVETLCCFLYSHERDGGQHKMLWSNM